VGRMNEKMQKQKLLDLRDGFQKELDQREREVDALRNKIKGVDHSIAAISGVEVATDPRRQNRRNVKRTVMNVINEAGKAGVTSTEVVQAAATKGKHLDRPSVSSLLSRLKREGVLSFDGERYHQIAGDSVENPRNLKVVGI